MTNELRANTEIDEWRIGKLIGRGGQGPVWEVRSTKAPNMPPRALKASFATEDRPRQRFVREIELLGKCDSPYIVKVLDAAPTWADRADTVQPFAYYVMEKCVGSLEAQTDLGVGSRLVLFRDACRSLVYLHTLPDVIIHRDIKPANFLIAEEPRRLVLTDFGIARELLASTLTATQEVVGSKYFRAPEVLTGDSGSVQSDVYSMGRVLEWLLTSDVSRTFETRPVPRGRDLSDEACDALDRLILRATQVAPANRFASVQEMMDHIPDLWFAIKPRPPTEEVDGDLSAVTVAPEALELARAKDMIGWRRLEQRLRRAYPERMLQWRAENEGPIRAKDELFALVDKLLSAVGGRIVLPLVGVYSQDAALVDQRRALHDLLDIPGWSDAGNYVSEGPRGLAYLFHHLHGAVCCDLGRMDLAVQLAEVPFPLRQERDTFTLWRIPDMHGSALLGKRTIAWEYLTGLPQRVPIVDELFALPRDFAVALASYSMLMCLLELGYDAAENLAALKAGQLKVIEMFNAPPMFGTMPADVIRAAADRTFGSVQTVAMIVARTNTKHETLEEVWPKWKPSLSRAFYGNEWNGRDQLRLGDLA